MFEREDRSRSGGPPIGSDFWRCSRISLGPKKCCTQMRAARASAWTRTCTWNETRARQRFPDLVIKLWRGIARFRKSSRLLSDIQKLADRNRGPPECTCIVRVHLFREKKTVHFPPALYSSLSGIRVARRFIGDTYKSRRYESGESELLMKRDVISVRNVWRMRKNLCIY